jgi:hypothetical protein
MVHQMGDCRKGNLCAVGCEEDLFSDKKYVNLQSYTSIELNELCGNFDDALYYPLAVPPHCVTIHLENRASPNHFGGHYILECNITTLDSTCTNNCPEICSEKEDHLFGKILCSSSTGNLPLAKEFHVVFDCLDKSKLTHLLCVANVQTTTMHLKEQVGEIKLLTMDNKGCFNLLTYVTLYILAYFSTQKLIQQSCILFVSFASLFCE